MTIGEVIRELRIARGWKQQTLAERSGLAQAFISQVERGHRDNLTMDVLRRFAVAFEMPVADLLRAAGESTPPAADELTTILSELEQLGVAPLTVAAYRQMGGKLTEPGDREAVLVAVRGLRDTIYRQQERVKSSRQDHQRAGEATTEPGDSSPTNDRISARGRLRRVHVY